MCGATYVRYGVPLQCSSQYDYCYVVCLPALPLRPTSASDVPRSLRWGDCYHRSGYSKLSTRKQEVMLHGIDESRPLRLSACQQLDGAARNGERF